MVPLSILSYAIENGIRFYTLKGDLIYSDLFGEMKSDLAHQIFMLAEKTKKCIYRKNRSCLSPLFTHSNERQ